MRLLVVDDSSTMRRIIVNTLQRLGYNDVLEAAHGLEAWSILDRSDNIDILITVGNESKIIGGVITMIDFERTGKITQEADETVADIQHRQGNQHGQRIRPGDAVDAVHEVVGIDDAHADYQRRDDRPPKFSADKAQVHEHQHHRRELHQQPPHIGHRTHVIRKTHCTYRRQSRHEPRIMQPEERSIQPRPHKKYDTPSPQRDTGMRTPEIRLVNNVQPVRHPKIKKLRHYEQSQDSGVRYPPSHKLFCKSFKYT